MRRRLDLRDRLDLEIAASWETLQHIDHMIDMNDTPRTRATLAQMDEATSQLPQPEGVLTEDRRIPVSAGGSDLRIRLYRPSDRPADSDPSAPLRALLWIHSGGFVAGSVEGEGLLAAHYAKGVGCVVASVDYCLAPEHPYTAPLEDC